MNLLLDTHIWIWSLVAPERLGKRAARALADPDNALFLSPITTWETVLLLERKRILVAQQPNEWVAEQLQRTPAREAALTHEVALTSRRLRLQHDDPADRFLAATSLVHGLTLVTADARLLACRDIRTLAS